MLITVSVLVVWMFLWLQDSKIQLVSSSFGPILHDSLCFPAFKWVGFVFIPYVLIIFFMFNFSSLFLSV